MRILLVLLGAILMLFGVASGGCAIRVLIDGLDVPSELVDVVDFLIPVVCLGIGAGITWGGVILFRRGCRPASRAGGCASPREES